MAYEHILGAIDSYMSGDDYMLGDDDELGARARRARAGSRTAAAVRQVVPPIPGVPKIGPKLYPLGFGSFTFVNAGVTANQFVARPQVPFKGRRLVVIVARTAGALGVGVNITDVQVGNRSQFAGASSVPAEVFAANAFDVVLDMDPATPGIDITLDVTISVTPPVGETVFVSATILGEVVS